jgi:dipeptidyl aminopeptidase/acylaminoacyl peptidase
MSIDVIAVENGTTTLLRVPLLGGPSRPIVTNIFSAVGWSPDGRMAFIRSSGDGRAEVTSLVIAKADGSAQRVLATRQSPRYFNNTKFITSFPVSRPSWSADGTSILVTGRESLRDSQITSEIILIDATTGAERWAEPGRQTFNMFILGAAWLDGSRVLIETVNQYRRALWTAAVDRLSDWAPLTHDSRWFLDVSLTADHATAVATHGERRTGIWMADGDGGSAHPVVGESALAAAFPLVDDSGAVFYTAETGDGLWALYRLAANAQRPTVVATKAWSGRFSMSRDGSLVALNGGEPPYPLLRVKSDGSGLMTLVDRNAWSPGISPDGQQVWFHRLGLGLFSIPMQGGTPRPLTTETIIDSPFSARPPVMSPNSKRAMVMVLTDNTRTLLLCDLPDCTNASPFILEASAEMAQWSPDGRGIAVTKNNGSNLWLQPFDGSPSSAITHYDDKAIREFSWSPDGKRLVFSNGHYVDDIVLIKGLH